MTMPAPNITACYNHRNYCLTFISRVGKTSSKKRALVSDTVCLCMLSHVQLFATPWTVAHQAPLSMEFSKQEYWSRLPFLPLGDLSDPGSESVSPVLQVDSLPTEPSGSPTCRWYRHTKALLLNLNVTLVIMIDISCVDQENLTLGLKEQIPNHKGNPKLNLFCEFSLGLPFLLTQMKD